MKIKHSVVHGEKQPVSDRVLTPILFIFFTLPYIGQDPKNKIANHQRPRQIVQPHQLKEPG